MLTSTIFHLTPTLVVGTAAPRLWPIVSLVFLMLSLKLIPPPIRIGAGDLPIGSMSAEPPLMFVTLNW